MSDESDDENQRIRKAIKKNKAGRPPKARRISANDTEFWFQDTKAVQIASLLGSRGQILFKCLSGPASTNTKEIKGERQKLSEFLQTHQEELLEKLLVDKYKSNIKYFFIGNNKTFFQHEDVSIQKLQSIIHPDFIKSFSDILNILRQDHFEIPEDMFNYNNHQHLVTWALITTWSQDGRDLLNDLQRPSMNNYETTKILIEEEKRKSKYQDVQNQSILYLLEENRNYKEEIMSLIQSLRELI